MNLEDLTIKQVRELAALAASLNLTPVAAIATPAKSHPWTDRYVLVRTYSAGVHVGFLQSISESGSVVTLSESRRIWSWNSERLSCSELATIGAKPSDKIACAVPIQLNGAIEVIPCSDAAIKSFREAAAWTR